MESVRRTQKKYGSRAIWVAILLGLCFFLAGLKPVGKGLLLGTIFSVINFVLIGQALPLRLGQTRRKTFIVSMGSIIFRYVLLAVPVVVAVKTNDFDLVASIVGLFMIQFVILAEHLLKLFSSDREK